VKIIKLLDKYIEEALLLLSTTVMVAAVSLQVFMRFAMGSSLGWSEELARYSFIMLIFVGISYAVKKQRHIKVDVLLLVFKDKGKVVLGIIANLVFLLFALFALFYGSKIAIQLLSWGQVSPALEIPMGFVYFTAPIGMGLTGVRLIQQLIEQVQYLLHGGEIKNIDLVNEQEREDYGIKTEIQVRQNAVKVGERL
jgi:TRAP-type C4-dicarboxylate transport system permease small subunit